jgi:cytochrome c oxidase cbb3-type subunit 3
MSASTPSGKPTRDEVLDHEADGIREFDNELPRWWLYGFYFTIVFASVYMVNYHVLPTPLFGKKGMVAEYEAEMQAAGREAAAHPVTALAVTAALTDTADLDAGRKIFEGTRNLCFSCHRADLGGMIGPNLTDDYWLHGCSAGELVANVKSGFPAKGMLPFGSGAKLSDQQTLQVVSYVLSKRGTNPPNPKALDAERDKKCEVQSAK